MNNEVNTKHFICYSCYGRGHPPQHYIEREQGADKILIWVGLMRNGTVFGPYVIRGNLTTREYLRIVCYNVIQRDFRANNINQNSIWLQQDGARSHTSNETINYLRRQFPGKVMSRRGYWPWPPRSPYLAIPDIFLWGHLKHRIWSVAAHRQPRNIRESEAAIVRECARIPPAFIQNAFDGMVERCQRCINVAGHSFDNE